MSNIATSLPFNINELSETFKIIFVGQFIPKAINFRNILTVYVDKKFTMHYFG